MNTIRNDEGIAAFFDGWNLYQKVITCNYMDHQEIHAILRKSLQNHFDRPFSITDLGCGDASILSKTLENLMVSTFTGVDLSEVALGKAQANLAHHPFKIHLIQSDFGEYMQDTSSFASDVITIGFALHHYTDNEKVAFLKQCYQKLEKGGILFIYDVFRRPGQTIAHYMDDYSAMIQKEWILFNSKEIKDILEHIHKNDHPAVDEHFTSWAQQAGFEKPNPPLYTDKSGFHCLYQFRKQ